MKTFSFFQDAGILVSMDRQRRLGLLLIVIGICIPLLTLPFLSGYSKDKGFFDNLYRVGIELRKDKRPDTGTQPFTNVERLDRKVPDFSRLIPRRIPFRFFLVPSLILFYVGFVKIEASRPKKEGQSEEEA